MRCKAGIGVDVFDDDARAILERRGVSRILIGSQASQVIEKFRSLIGTLAFADAGLDGSALAKLLSWNELIHTTYFTVPRFRVLIAYAIAQTSGFCASDALQRHPDYVFAEQWYVAITTSTAR